MRKLIFATLALVFVIATPGAGTCGPLLNEMMADPAQDWDGDGTYEYRRDEWIEIVNPDLTPLDLAGYYLADDAGGLVYGFTGTLAPGEVRVVYGSESIAWETANGVSTTGLRLGNDGDTAQLLQMVGGVPVLVDAYTYNTYEAEDDRSSGRMPDGGVEWQLFDALNPYGGSASPPGNGLPPTPGSLNDGGSPPVPTLEANWGQIKALYSSM